MSTALRGSTSCAPPDSFIFVGNLAHCKPLIAAGLRRGKRILYSPEVHPAREFIRRDIYDLMILDKTIEYIVAHCREPLELADVAHVACMSRFHFCRLFKKWTGLSFKSFLIHCRIEIAKRMLTLGVDSVTEVCYAVGFADLSNFDRTFHRFVGQSPMQYRKSTTAVRERRSKRTGQVGQSVRSRGVVGLA